MPSITIRDLTVRYDKVVAVSSLALHVEEGEFMVLLGASGSGKTTTLRAIAGLEQPVEGEIVFGDEAVFSAVHAVDQPPSQRGVGMVFQSYALYPHMTVMQNIAFPLKTHGVPRERIAFAVEKALALVDLTGLEERYPRQLSGGQQQRVAVARMMVSEPKVLLFDEPLSNIDAKLRVMLRADLKSLHRKIGATSIYVTHDVSEALALADRIAVMFDGVIHHIGLAAQIYNYPETVAVAEMTGSPRSNLIAGTIRRTRGQAPLLAPDADPGQALRLPGARNVFDGQRVVLNVRAEELRLRPTGAADGADGAAAGARLEVFAVLPQGAATLVHLRFPGTRHELVVTEKSSATGSGWQRGQLLTVEARRGNLFDADTERLIDSFDATEHSLQGVAAAG